MGRERRNWTNEEDELLRSAVYKAQSGLQPIDWQSIASSIPGRTNKDCRKRWHNKVSSTVKKGPWSDSEDERLSAAVEALGTKWSKVAAAVSTRNGDQCSKRWNTSTNPEIDHSPWKPEEDKILMHAVQEYGRNWQVIVSEKFPRRSALSAKNRHHLLSRKPQRQHQKSRSSSTAKASTCIDPQDITVDRDHPMDDCERSPKRARTHSMASKSTSRALSEDFDSSSFPTRSTSLADSSENDMDFASASDIFGFGSSSASASITPEEIHNNSNPFASNLGQDSSLSYLHGLPPSEFQYQMNSHENMSNSKGASHARRATEPSVNGYNSNYFNNDTMLDADTADFMNTDYGLCMPQNEAFNNDMFNTHHPTSHSQASQLPATSMDLSALPSSTDVVSPMALSRGSNEPPSRLSRRVTIEADCPTDQLGHLMQSISAITKNSTFKTQDPY